MLRALEAAQDIAGQEQQSLADRLAQALAQSLSAEPAAE